MVNTIQIEQQDFRYEPKYTEVVGTVSSVRLDSILAVAFHTSRSSLSGLIEGGKVFVNSKEVLSNSYLLKENDVVSVRGLGKFLYVGTSYQTKKGRLSVKILLYS
jgi:RNA-binding protein YlmH